MPRRKDSEEQLETQNNELDLVLAEIRKQFGSGSIIKLDEEKTSNIECFSTGILSLDLALGRGIPKGRIIEFYGLESTAKSTLALKIVSEVQKNGGKAAWIDTEMAFDKIWAKINGVKTNELIFAQPDFAEEALTLIEKLAQSQQIDLIILDSVASLVCKAELDGDMGQSHMGLTARLMSQALRKLVGVCSKTNTTVIFINQMRQNIGIVYGSNWTVTGGNALRFYTSIRCELKRKETIKHGDAVLATIIEVNVKKNKVANPYKKASFEISFDIGISRLSDLINLAQENKLIERSGAWYIYNNNKYQGLENLKEFFKQNPPEEDTLKDSITKILENK